MKLIVTGEGKREKFWRKEGLSMQQITRQEYDKLLAEEKAKLPQVSEPAEPGLGTGNWKTPLLSDALAVHPSQIDEAMKRNAAHGLHVEYEKEYGRPILRSRAEQRALMKIEKCHDNNCFN